LTTRGSFSSLDAAGRARVLSQIEDFLDLTFYSYHVEIGPLRRKD